MCAQTGVHRSPSAHQNSPRVHLYALTAKIVDKHGLFNLCGRDAQVYPNRTILLWDVYIALSRSILILVRKTRVNFNFLLQSNVNA